MEFDVLGPLRVREGTEQIPLTAQMSRTLLGILLTRADTPVPVDVLVDALWGSRFDENAPKKLQLHVHRLRRALGDPSRVRFEHSGYALRVHPGELDAERFDALLAEGTDAVRRAEPSRGVDLIRRALGLWRGEPYGDLTHVPLLRAEADRLTARRVGACEELYAAELAGDRAVAIVPEIAELAGRHPLRERLQGLLMTALYRAGRQAEALEVYRRTRAALVDELGLEPAGELQRLHQAILAADPGLEPAAPPPASRPAELPADIAEFTGREAQVDLVRDHLLATPEDGVPRAVLISAIAGKAGVGKTTLAVHTAHRLRDEFPDGQLYVDLRGAGAHPLAPADVLVRFLHALGMNGAAVPDDLDERAALFRSRVAGRRLLVLLDNAAGEAQLRPLLPGTAGCAVLVTSRSRLAGLPARLVDLDMLDPERAVELLARIAGVARVDAEPAAAGKIARTCGYLPLALRIAAARLVARPHWSLARLAALLADERHRLDELRLGDLEVRASLTLSYEGLGDTARRAFRMLGLLDAPDFAAWVAAALLDVPLPGARQVVEQLVDAQLLDIAGEDATGEVRYRFHDLLRLYARERLHAEEPDPDRRAALTRVLGGALTLSERAAELLWACPVVPGTVPRWRLDPAETEALLADPSAWLEAERLSLVAGIEQAVGAGLAEPAWRLAKSLAFFLDVRGYLDDYRRTHERALSASHLAGSDAGAGHMLRGLGMVHIVQDRYDDALDCLQQAHAAFRRCGDRHGEADVGCSFGVLYRVLGRPAEALECYRRALPTYREAGDRAGEAFALYSHGVLLLELGRLADARPYLERALTLNRELRYRRGEGQVLRRMGVLYQAEGRPDEAVSCLQRCLDIFDEFGDRQLTAYALQELAAVYAQQGQGPEAASLLGRSLPIVRELGDRHGEARTLLSLGELHLVEARLDEAAVSLTCALRIWDGLDLPLWQARARRSLGEAHAAAGDQAAAETAWREALILFGKAESPEAAEIAERLGVAVPSPEHSVGPG